MDDSVVRYFACKLFYLSEMNLFFIKYWSFDYEFVFRDFVDVSWSDTLTHF